MAILVRHPRVGDGTILARCWLNAGAYYAAVNPTLLQVPEADGLGQWFEERLDATSDDRRMLVADKDGQVEEWAGDRGASIVLLDTYIGSDLSVPFYEQRMGYSRRAVRFSKTL